MDALEQFVLPCFWAFLACAGFAVVFNIHGLGILICCAGGALGWLSYLVMLDRGFNDFLSALAAGLVISAWSEAMARIRKCPVTGYLLVAFFPLVPGGGIYYAMDHAIRGEMTEFANTLMHTLEFSGALALGVFLVSSAMRMVTSAKIRRRTRHRGNG